MHELARGNIIQADAEALVNTVNCVGYMGKGIALQFKKAFSDNFMAYASACFTLRTYGRTTHLMMDQSGVF